MRTRTTGIVACLFMLGIGVCQAQGDISAEMGALMDDVTAPYAPGKYAPPAEKKAAYDKAVEILRKEHLLASGRPQIASADLVSAYGQALALGPSVKKVLPEIGQLHGAAAHNDRVVMRASIGSIYQKIGRKIPEGDVMEKLVDAARDAAIKNNAAEQSNTITKPDYQVNTKYSPRFGTVETEVRGTDDKGEPFRAIFAGDVQARPAANGKDLELNARPEEKPNIIGPTSSKKIAETIKGDWIDQDGKIWNIEIQGSALTLTGTGKGTHRVVYHGTYDLGQLTAEHKVDHPDDMTGDLPAPVKAQLASTYHPPYNVKLQASENVDRLNGMWTSLNVTYLIDFSIESVHTEWDTPLVLTRGKKTADSGTALGMKEGDLP